MKMRQFFLFIIFLSGFSEALFSQSTAQVITPNLASGSSSTAIWRFEINRVQAVYDASHWTSQGIYGPITIKQLEWRAFADVASTITYPSVEIYIQPANVDYSAVSTTFASNRSASLGTPNYSGPVTVNTGTAGTYVINIPLAVPFKYVPSLGTDLLVELVILAAPTPATSTAIASSNNSSTYKASVVRSNGSTTALTGTISEFTPILRSTYDDFTTNVSTCGSYTWGINNQTYTQSGTYTSGDFILNLDISPCSTGPFIYAETGNFSTLELNVPRTVKFSRNNTLTMMRTSALGDGSLASSDCLTFPATNPFNQAHIAGAVSMFELDYSPSRGTGVGTVNYEFEFSDVLSTQGYMVFSDIDFREEIMIKAYKANGDLIPYSEMIMKRENGQYATGSSYLNTKFYNIGSSYSGVLTTWNDNNVSNPVVTLQSIHPIKRVVFEINLNVDAANDSKTMRFNFINPTSPAIVYVNHSAVGLNNGTSWSDAYTSFQAGYENSFSGDQLWVAKGTYRPSSTHYLSNLVDRNKHFRIPERVEVYGGFAGTETAVSQRVNFGYGEANNTLLSGDLLGDDNHSLVPWTGSVENTYHVIYQPNEASCALNDITLLDGFSISGGYADGAGTDNNNDGGGIFINDHSPRLRNIDLVNNACIDNGGGLYIRDSQSIIENITVKFNRAQTSVSDGGGISIIGGSPQFTNSLVVDNLAQRDGGGFYISASKTVITNATIANNRRMMMVVAFC